MTKFILVSRGSAMKDAWRKHFAGQDNVSIVEGDICQVECDAIVSPANSFGFMDGGLDYALSERFGWGLQARLQRSIRDIYGGELLVGQAEIVPTEDSKVPWLIAAPTMRVPMSIVGTVNVYLAMRAIIWEMGQYGRYIRTPGVRPIKTVAISGLGTGVGCMPVEVAAHQMWAAYDRMFLGNNKAHEDVGVAQDSHYELIHLGVVKW